MEIKRLPASEGVCLVTKMVKSGYLSKRSSIVYSVLSIAKNRKVVAGKQKAFNAEHILKLNNAIREIAQELLSVRITEESDVLIQLRELRDVVCFPYVFQTIMGKSADWQKLRLSKKVSARKNGREYTMLGKFTSDEVCQINDAIRVIALTLLSIELVSDNPNNSETPTQSVDIKSNAKDKSDHCIAETISGTLSSAEGEVSHVDIKPSMPNDDFGDADLLLYEEMMLAEMEQGD